MSKIATKNEEANRAEIEKNFRAMCEQIDNYMPLYTNQYALMRDGEVVEFYLRFEDAYKTGRHFYDDGLFSIQKVTKNPVDLGYFSRAEHIR